MCLGPLLFSARTGTGGPGQGSVPQWPKQDSMLSPGHAACQETAGFLFSHSCKNPAMLHCGTCGKPVCAEHVRPSSTGGPTCASCRNEGDASSEPSTGDDPYAYSGAWYSDYRGYDRTDHYSRADRQAFQGNAPGEGVPMGVTEGGAEAWESDFDAS